MEKEMKEKREKRDKEIEVILGLCQRTIQMIADKYKMYKWYFRNVPPEGEMWVG